MSVKILGKLPDPFRKEDGTRMTQEEWYAQRDKLFNKICEIEYGGMPPRPEVVKVVRLTSPRELMAEPTSTRSTPVPRKSRSPSCSTSPHLSLLSTEALNIPCSSPETVATLIARVILSPRLVQ